jgi:phosphate transport system substrate-binding protein
MKYSKVLSIATAALAIALPVFAQDKLVIKGSDTLGAKMIPKIAEAYENKNPGSKFEIAAEGSSTGIAAIIEGSSWCQWRTPGKDCGGQRCSCGDRE